MKNPRLMIEIDLEFAELHKSDWQQKIPWPKTLSDVQLEAKSRVTKFPVTVF
jgi:hypothetical protein